MENKKTLLAIIILALIIVLLIGAGIFIYKKYSKTPTSTLTPTEKESTTLGGQIYNEIQNPAEKIPQTNPFEAKINPFKGIYKNPF